MICQKKRKFLYFGLSLFICVYSVLCSSIGSYASGGAGHGYNWTASEQVAHWTSSLGDVAGYAKDWALNNGTWDNVKTAIFDAQTIKAQEAQMSYDDWVLSNTSWYYKDGSEYQNESTLDHISMSQEMADCFNTTINNYIQENPLTYKKCTLYSYNFLNPNSFSTYQQFATTKEYIKNGGNRYSVILNSQGNILISQYLTQDMNLGFIGTSSNGNFTSVNPYVNWQTLGNMMLSPAVSINSGGTVTQVTNTNWYGYNNLKNTASPNTSNKIIMSPNEKNETVYVFETLAAYKNYNAGAPQPYYLGSGFDTIKMNIPASITDGSYNSSNYNNIVNNVQSGWTAEQVLELVDKVLSNGGGSGNGSDSSDSDSLDLGWLGKIGGVIVKIVNAIASVITDVIDGIATALIGEDGTGGIVGTLKTILHNVVELVTEDFTEFMSEIFGFLPPEISTILVAGISLSVFFGVIKILRK